MEHNASASRNLKISGIGDGTVSAEHMEINLSGADDPNANKASEIEKEKEPPKTWKDYAAANGIEIHESGGYMAMKVRKLDEAFQRGAERFAGLPNSNMFSGVCIYVNGYTKPSGEELRRIMQRYGGRYSNFYTKSKVTHVVATNLCKSKLLTMRASDNVVHPDWIVDSMKAGRMLDFNEYRLPGYSSTRNASINRSAFDLSAVASSSGVKPNTSFSAGNSTVIDSVPSVSVPSHIDADKTVDCSTKFASNTSVAETPVYDSNSVLEPTPIETETTCAVAEAEAEVDSSKVDGAGVCALPPTETSNSSLSAQAPPGTGKAPLDCRQPGFLSAFYARSRLHFLSTWHFELVDYVIAARNRASDPSQFTGRRRLIEMAVSKYSQTDLACSTDQRCVSGGSGDIDYHNEPVIFHMDLDCFFASVSLRDRPELANEPVCVTHSKTGVGKASSAQGHSSSMSFSEIASCNYAARKFGVRNGMFVGEAMKRCPNMHFVEYDFDAYRSVSRLFYDLVLSYTMDIEAVSCDEMYGDMTSLIRDVDKAVIESRGAVSGAERVVDPLFVADAIRAHVFETCRVNCSIGVGSNKLLARLATRRAKPNGAFRVRARAARTFMRDVAVTDLPGVGYSIAERLRSQFGVTVCADVLDARRVSVTQLQSTFGSKLGLQIAEKCAGDCRSGEFAALRFGHDRKSVNCDVNYGIRFTSPADANRFLTELADEVASRLRSCAKQARKLTLRLLVRSPHAPKETRKFLGHGVCDALTRSVLLPTPAGAGHGAVIARECIALFGSLRVDVTDVRGVAIQASKLVDERSAAAASNGNQRTILDFMNDANSNEPQQQQPRTKTKPNASEDALAVHNSVSVRPRTADDFNLTEQPKTKEHRASANGQKDSSLKSKSESHFRRVQAAAPVGKSNSVGITVEDAALDFSFQTRRPPPKRASNSVATLERFGIGPGTGRSDPIANAVPAQRPVERKRDVQSRKRSTDCIVISSDSETENDLPRPAGTRESPVALELDSDVNSRDLECFGDESDSATTGTDARTNFANPKRVKVTATRRRGRPPGSHKPLKLVSKPKPILKRKRHDPEVIQVPVFTEERSSTFSSKRKHSVQFQAASTTAPTSERSLSRVPSPVSWGVGFDEDSASMASVSISTTIGNVQQLAAPQGFNFEALRTAVDEIDVARVFRRWVFSDFDFDGPIDLDATTALERCTLPKDEDVENLSRFLVSLISAQQLDGLVRCVRVLRYVVASLMATTTQCSKQREWYEAQRLIETTVQQEFSRKYRHATLHFDFD